MDTRVFCVYNRTRRLFLSAKVAVADGENEPLKILKVMVSGIGLDAETGLWLNPLNSTPTVPRLFPFDLVYLDQEHIIVDAAEVLPGVEFPSYIPGVTSALVFPHDTLRLTQTRRGDRLLVCPEEDAERLIAAAEARQDTPGSTEAGPECPVPSKPAEPAPAEAVVSAGAPAVEESVEGGIGGVDEGSGDSGKLAQVWAQEPKSQRVDASPGSVATEAPAVPAEKPKVAVGPTDPSPPTQPLTHEAPPAASEEPRAPANLPAEDEGEIEEMFANWVESPSALIAQKLRPSAAEVDAATQRAVASTALAHSHAGNEGVLKPDTPQVGQPGGAESTQAGGPVLSGPEMKKALQTPGIPPPTAPGKHEPTTGKPELLPGSASQPVKPSIPQPPRAVSFTVAQYGMWQVNAPPTSPKPVPPAMKEGAVDRDARQPATSESSAKKRTESPRPPVMSSGDLEKKSEAATERTEPIAASASAKTDDFESRLANAMTNAAPGWGTGSGGETDESLDRWFAHAEDFEVDRGGGWQTEKIVEATGKPVPEDFASLVQEKLDRLQAKEKPGPVEAVKATSEPAREKPVAAKEAIEKSHAGAGAPGSGPLSTPTRSLGLSARLRNWLNPTAPAARTGNDRRRAQRRYVPGMVAHYFTGGAPQPYDVADISLTGFYLLTGDRWTPNTLVRMTLQKPGVKGGQKQSITVLSRIVRRGSDGVGAEFVMPESLDPHSRDVMPTEATDRVALARFL